MAYDKKLHFLAGLCIAVAAMLLCFYYNGTVNLWIGLGCGMGAGVAKEIYDEYDYGGFDYVDMFATWLGAAAGAGLAYIVF